VESCIGRLIDHPSVKSVSTALKIQQTALMISLGALMVQQTALKISPGALMIPQTALTIPLVPMLPHGNA